MDDLMSYVPSVQPVKKVTSNLGPVVNNKEAMGEQSDVEDTTLPLAGPQPRYRAKNSAEKTSEATPALKKFTPKKEKSDLKQFLPKSSPLKTPRDPMS